MKVLLNFSLLTLFLTISNEIFSQDFISENKTWNVVVKVGFDEYITTKTVTYKFLGDTTIHQINYKKLLEADNEQKSNWKLNSLWFEKNDSVFKYSSMHDENILIYDFNIAEKDSFTIMENVFYLIVDSIRTKAWGGKEREFIYFHPSEIYSNWGQTVWIKGVGHTGNFTRSTEIGIAGAFCSLLCFEENGELVYQNPEYNSCYVFTSVPTIKKEPNIVKVHNTCENLITVNPLSSSPGIIEVYNISGRKIIQKKIEITEIKMTLPSKGTYIYRVTIQTGEMQTGKIIVN